MIGRHGVEKIQVRLTERAAACHLPLQRFERMARPDALDGQQMS
jgi:hypothetical protein